METASENKYVLFTINIYVKADDLKAYKIDDSKIVEMKIRRYLSLYLIDCEVKIIVNILPVISNISHIEINMNMINSSSSFISSDSFTKDIHDCLVSILPSKIDTFLINQFKDSNFVVIED